jgi:hypothetical protein
MGQGRAVAHEALAAVAGMKKVHFDVVRSAEGDLAHGDQGLGGEGMGQVDCA